MTAMFDASMSMALGDVDSAKFWTDAWLPASPIQSFTPHLFGVVGCRFHGRSVKEGLHQRR